ncbi:tRNA uridine-5-carboxymethylaminomethyl(34) synthesis GTPase MnmE [Thermodesulfobacteriota bacterium]
MYHQDTIAAVATPVGSGGIGIVKISGPDSIAIAKVFFRSAAVDPEHPVSHRLYYGVVYDPEDGCVLDDALMSYMQAPSSYTGEHVVEINCHSGITVLQKILELALNAGARPAEPGEFTKRAFLNGRIDLTQAEAVIDVIEARTETSLKLASRSLTGKLSETIHAIRDQLVEIRSALEACIDFPEDDIDILDSDHAAELTHTIADSLARLIATFAEGSLYRVGIDVVIIGKPNTGKSSLLNALLGERRAIVTPVPGTTRDIIRETIALHGIPVRLHDTAGLHHSPETIEQIGIDLTINHIQNADLALLVLDGNNGLDAADLSVIAQLDNKTFITVINKADLAQKLDREALPPEITQGSIIAVSSLLHTGVEDLKEAITQAVLRASDTGPAEILISNARHKAALSAALESLKLVAGAFSSGQSYELIAVDLQAALNSLGELTGETTTDDILDIIFSKFCIGK